MFVEGRIETTNWQKITVSPVPFGLDMAEKRRLLDQRTTFQTKCQVASNLSLSRKGYLFRTIQL